MKLLELLKTDNWRDVLYSKGIQTFQEGSLRIFKYDMLKCNFTEPYTLECRGSIVDMDTLEFVCNPFLKFFNISEHKASKIDWSKATVFEKLDGSLIKAWFYKDKWIVSTNGTIYAENAPMQDNVLGIKNFYELVEKAVGNPQEFFENKFGHLKHQTHMFELTSLINRIVCKYDGFTLWYLGSKDTQTGVEFIHDIDMPKPKQYPFNSKELAIEMAESLSSNEEGFVVFDGVNRVKIKSSLYVSLHHLAGRMDVPKNMFEAIMKGEAEEVLAYFPDMESELREQQSRIEKVKLYFKLSEEAYKQQTFADTKSSAVWIKENYDYPHYLFTIMRGKSVDEFWNMDYKMFKQITESIGV